jgi:DNA polymerase III subunit delta'
MAGTPEDLPDPTQIEGAPHPRDTAQLIGHGSAEQEFLTAFNAGRLHHGWLINGPRGVGKATLAWRLARFLLATADDQGGMFATPPPVSLDIPTENPIARRISAQTESRLFHLKRGANSTGSALSDDIRVDEVRKLKSFFTFSAADGGRRVAIVDCADELATAGANALLKLLEEPPEHVTLILISHQPHRLLPTIRSRCRTLRLGPLSATDLSAALTQAGGESDPAHAQALAELAGGSVGEAFRLTSLDGLEIYARLVGIMTTLPRLDRTRLLTMADQVAGKANDAKFTLALTLLDLLLARLARTGSVGHPPPQAAHNESALLSRLSPNATAARQWADLAQTLGAKARRGRAVNLDPSALLMDMFLAIDAAAGALARR